MTERASPGWSLILGTLLFFLPFSIEMVLSETQEVRLGVRIPLADAMLWLALFLCLVSRAKPKADWRTIGSPSLLLVGISLLASVPMLWSGASWTEILQRVDAFLVAYFVVLLAPIEPLKKVMGPALAVVTSLFLAVGLIQVYVLKEPPWRVTSVFENRHLFGAWTAIVLAVVVARGPWKGYLNWFAVGAFCAAALVTSTTLLPLLGLAVGTAVVWWYQRRWRGLLFSALTMVALVAAFSLIVPRAHARRALEEWEVNDIDTLAELRARGAEIDGLFAKLSLLSLPWGDRTLTLLSPNWHPAVSPPPDPRRESVFEPAYVRQRYLEWQAGLNAVGADPVLGSGLGNYQRSVSRNYLTFKKLKTLEPDTQNGYLVEAVSTGLAGLFALVWFLVDSCCRAREGVRRDLSGAESAMCRSALAGLLTSALIGFAAPVFTCFLAILITGLAVIPYRMFPDTASISIPPVLPSKDRDGTELLRRRGVHRPRRKKWSNQQKAHSVYRGSF